MTLPSKLEYLLFRYILGYINQPIHAKILVQLQRHTFATMDAFYAHFNETHRCSKPLFQREVDVLRDANLIQLDTTRSEEKRHALTPTLTPKAIELLAKAQSTIVPK